ncbi:ComEC/Rec2 family competence protein [Qipengyuania sp. JC766]|uniref:ComEC/Rec2 family competence protein n=1 Tax=Qipengyuania sp. JC766 TaxID=3232139 RepID=UPI0034576F96
MSSIADRAEAFLDRAGFDRAPWLTVAFAGGIALWFTLAAPWQWCAAIGACLLLALGAFAVWRDRPGRVELQKAVIALPVMVALGIGVVWARSELVGAEAIDGPRVERFDARILEREEQPAQDRIRLVLAMHDSEAGEARKVRVNVPLAMAAPGLREGVVIRLRARLMPPAPPMLPGSYDFARRAWFEGLAATGAAIGKIEIVEGAGAADGLAQVQRYLASHVRSQLGASPGTIAAAFASGDRGAISEADEEAMRDAGLTHLLSISGLHVSAVIAAAYLLALKLLALWPWLALRVRLPLMAAAIGALAGVGYTLLTGAEVPTVRSCVGALLVLIALAMGREALSMRMVAVAAFIILLVWPETLVGPSFQLSFSAVLAIVALHNSAPVKAFLAPREEGWLASTGRKAVMLLVTGLVIEIALMPIVLSHFHRAGVYGAFANVFAIPLVTFGSMPLIALALFADLVGLGAPFWWLAGKSLDLLLAIAHWTADQPGSVKLMPDMGRGLLMLFVAGGLWLALWKGRARLLGLVPAGLAAMLYALKPAPDLLISNDGRHVGIAGEGERLLMLRDTRSDYAKDNFNELAGLDGEPVPLAEWENAECSPDFCVITLERAGRSWSILMARSRNIIEERALAAACERADIVVADRWLPRSCRPRWLKADRKMLAEEGGLAIDLSTPSYSAVADTQGAHGWWRGESFR